MAKLVQDTSLTSVADAIRAKTGGTDSLTFPSEFVSAINGITAATKPYVEETFDESNSVIGAALYGYTYTASYMFYNHNKLVSVSLPDGILLISHHAFEYCTNLALTALPNTTRTIGYYAFHNCTSLAITALPSGLIFIQGAGFKGCTNLTSIVFGGTPQYVESDAFLDCTNLTDIKVPWAEGAVAGAPWGATNATITYNYTGA